VLGERIGYFGDYVLLDEIARGSCGVVFRARQTSLNRIVALKMLRSNVSQDDGQVERFRAEAEAAAGLSHPNIVPIYEVGEHDGQCYFSMRLIEGGTLISRAADFRDPHSAAKLMVKVASAVQAAHDHGLLHRDIKPGNILIDTDGEPQVTDFGIARRLGLDSSLTLNGQIMGTPYYMSPEQARGETQTLTPAADVYGIGAVLYELLTGAKPFGGEGLVEVLKKVIDDPVPAPTGMDRDLRVIVMKCLEKEPAARYASATALADDLEKWLQGEPITARPTGRVERLFKWVRRSPYKAALFVLGAVCLISWFALASFLLPKPQDATVAASLPPPGYAPGGDFIQAKAGRTVDVLRLIQIANPRVLSLWRKDGSALVGQQSNTQRIALSLPIHTRGNYDLQIDCTLSDLHAHAGRRTLPLLAMPVGDRYVQLVLGSASGCDCPLCLKKGKGKPLETTPKTEHPLGFVSGLQLINSQPLATNGTGVFHHQLTADTPHTLAVQVRLLPDAQGSFTATLDKQPFISWKGPLADLPFQGTPNSAPEEQKQFFFTVWNQIAYTIRYDRLLLTPLSDDAWLRMPVVGR
jgi:hypothetical protein